MPTTTLLIALLAAAPAAAGAGETADWPGFRGDGTGRARAVLPPGDGPLRLELRWKRTLGSGYAGMVVADGLLVTAFGDGAHDLVAALDAETGEERWRYTLAPAYPGNDGSHAGPLGTPAVSGGRVFALGPRGDFVALSLVDGAELWRTHLVDDVGCEKPLYGYAASPAVSGGAVVLPVGCPEGAVAGFAAATGEVLWRAVDDVFEAQSAVVTELGGRTQALLLGDTALHGLDPETGQVLWQSEHGGAPNANFGAQTQAPLPVGGDRVFIKHDNAATLLLRAHEGDDGWSVERIREAKGLHRSYSPPTLWGEQAYGYTARFLSALDLETGDLLWRSRDPGDGFLVAADGMLAVLTKEGSLYLGRASPEGWTETARMDLFDDLAWTPPAVSGNGVFLRSFGEIARVDLVRAAAVRTADDGTPLPAALRPLAASLAGGAEPGATVDAFLEDRALPLVDGDEVVFLWRGDARDVAVAGHMIGMRREEQMRRLEGTDLWWWSTRLDRRARSAYLFYVDYEPTLDPANPRRTHSTLLGHDMNWLMEEPIPLSWFAMPEWPGPGEAGEAAPDAGGRMETLTLEIRPATPEGAEPADPASAAVHVWLPPGYDDAARTDVRYPVVFVVNPHARTLMEWPATLDRVVGVRVRPLIVAFVEPPRARGLSAVFDEQVAAEIDARFRTRQDAPSRAVVGMGFQSLLAAAIGLRHRDRFGRIGLQSVLALDLELDSLEGWLNDEALPRDPVRVYFEWGRWDLNSPHENMDMRTSARRIETLLGQHGVETVGGPVWDSTDVGSWKNRTGVLLEALFPLEGDGGVPAALEPWLAEEP